MGDDSTIPTINPEGATDGPFCTLCFIVVNAEKKINFEFAPNRTVAVVKEGVLNNWPEDYEKIHSTEDLRIIFQGKVLENKKTLQDYNVPTDTSTFMHLMIRHASAKEKDSGARRSKAGAAQEEDSKCPCVIL